MTCVQSGLSYRLNEVERLRELLMEKADVLLSRGIGLGRTSIGRQRTDTVEARPIWHKYLVQSNNKLLNRI